MAKVIWPLCSMTATASPTGWIAPLVFVVFFAGTMGYNLKLHLHGKGTDQALLNQEILRAEEHGDRGALGHFCIQVLRLFARMERNKIKLPVLAGDEG